ncbi:uncharacterized protein [Amphiura filiformis]|uniref:uncharacterized protein n=1 Tax=Amphiura filiformis TaxID=82378 RepID=UPI003B20D9FC
MRFELLGCQAQPCSYVDPLVDAKVYVGSCDENAGASELDSIERNVQCDSDVSSSEISSMPTAWVGKQCNNYQGQYVYIVQESLKGPLRLCEIEVWGKEVDDADKPKVGFIRESLSDLEETLANGSPYVPMVKKSGGSASNKEQVCCSFEVIALTGLSDMATKAGSTGDETADFDDAGVPSGRHEFTPASMADIPIPLDVTVHNDFCPAPDEQFGYQINLLDLPSACAVADPSVVTGPTYETTTFVIENDDVTYCWQDTTLSVDEDTGVITAILTRTGYTAGSSVAYVITSDDDEVGANPATADVDYDAILTPLAVEFGVGITEIPVMLTILQDDDCEVQNDDETFLLVIDQTTDVKICTAADGTTELTTVRNTIIHDDAAFRFQLASYSVTETKKEVEVVVELAFGPLDKDAMIRVISQPLNPNPTLIAAMPEDYKPIDALLTIDAGGTTASITVEVLDDKLVEADVESFQLILVKEPLDSPDCVLENPSLTQIMIEDDDCCWRVGEEELTTIESDGKVDIPVTCERDPTSTVVPVYPVIATLQIHATGVTGQPQATLSEDYSLSSTTDITINSAISTTSTWSFTIKDDGIAEPTEYLDVSLVSANDGELCGPLTTRVGIEDNDASVRIASCGGDNTILESGKNLSVTLERIGDDSRSDSIILYTDPKTATPGTTADYDHFDGLVQFAAMQKTIVHQIVINDDLVPENDETFEVFIRPYNQRTVVDSTANSCEVTILDDDCTFLISIPETSRVVTEGTGVTVPITVTRQGYLSRPASVWVETSAALDADNEGNATPGEDYNPLSTLVTFLPDQASQTIDVTINGDDKPEIIERLRVSLSGGDCSINGINSVVIDIQDDDEVIISMRDDEITVNEDVENACVVLYRTGSLSRTDKVKLTVVPKSVPDRSREATAGADIIINDNGITVTFDSNEDEQRACVRVYNDTKEETGLESFSVRISNIVPGSSGVPATIDDDRRETCVFIRDNDGAFRLNCPSQRVSESVGSVTCTVQRTGPATNMEVAYISTSNGDAASLADYEPFSGRRVEFDQGVKSKPFTIKIYDDKDLEGSEDFFVFLAADSGGSTDSGQSVAIITILDDDNVLTLGSPPGSSTTPDCVLVPESIGSVRLTVYRSAYGSQLPSGITSARVSSREINPGSANVRSPADGKDVDYTDVNTEITFSNGQTRVDVLVQINDDEVGEPQEAFEVVLRDSTPESNNRIAYPSVVTICINDDDGGVDIDDEGDDGAGDDIGGGRVSRSLIVGLGGGLGLLLLVGVLGLIGCVAFSRWSQRTAPPPSRPVIARRVPRAVEPRRVARVVEPQRGYPPPYYAVDPFDVERRDQQGPRSIAIGY